MSALINYSNETGLQAIVGQEDNVKCIPHHVNTSSAYILNSHHLYSYLLFVDVRRYVYIHHCAPQEILSNNLYLCVCCMMDVNRESTFRCCRKLEKYGMINGHLTSVC